MHRKHNVTYIVNAAATLYREGYAWEHVENGLERVELIRPGDYRLMCKVANLLFPQGAVINAVIEASDFYTLPVFRACEVEFQCEVWIATHRDWLAPEHEAMAFVEGLRSHMAKIGHDTRLHWGQAVATKDTMFPPGC